MKKESGITLIALVITIIVLLILAGISIATLTGENGVLTKAEESKEITRGRSVEEAKNLWKNEKEIDKHTETSTAQELDELLDDLRTQNLITEGEKQTIKNTGEITIGGIKIEFLTMINFKFTLEYLDEPYTVEVSCSEGQRWGDLVLPVWDYETNMINLELFETIPEEQRIVVECFTVGTWNYFSPDFGIDDEHPMGNPIQCGIAGGNAIELVDSNRVPQCYGDVIRGDGEEYSMKIY